MLFNFEIEYRLRKLERGQMQNTQRINQMSATVTDLDQELTNEEAEETAYQADVTAKIAELTAKGDPDLQPEIDRLKAIESRAEGGRPGAGPRAGDARRRWQSISPRRTQTSPRPARDLFSLPPNGTSPKTRQGYCRG